MHETMMNEQVSEMFGYVSAAATDLLDIFAAVQ